MCSSSGIQFLGKLSLLAQQDRKRVFILFPVVYLSASHSAINSSFGYGSADLGDESWIDGLGDEVFATKSQVVHLIDIVHHIGNGLLGQIGNSVNSGQFHLFVDGCGMNVKCTAEDIGEADHVVDLVRIVCTTGGHQGVGTSLHSVLVADFRYGVSQCEDDRVLGH